MRYANKKDDKDIKAGKAKCSGHEIEAKIWLTVEANEKKSKEYMDELLNWLNTELENAGNEIMGNDGEHGWAFTSQKKSKFKVLKF
jgi:hypothetical protein